MTTASMRILDPVSDTNRTELARLVKVYPFPDFVKKASLEQITDTARLPVSAYADPINKAFPCHSAAATWLSGLYYNEKKAAYKPAEQSKIEARFAQFSDYFSISSDFLTMQKQAEDLKTGHSASDSDFAYVWQDPQGNKERRLPIRSAEEVKMASAWLEQYRDEITFEDRHAMAKRILEKQAQFSVEIDNIEFLEKQAGYGVCNPETVVDEIAYRAYITDNLQQKKAAAQLAVFVRDHKRSALQIGNLVKLASCLDDLDRDIGLTGKYTGLLRRPEDIIFETTFSKAASAVDDAFTTVTGNVYSTGDLEKVSYAALQEVFGDDLASEVSNGVGVDAEKLAAVAHTLPLPDARLFDQFMAESQIKPQLGKQAADVISKNDLANLATQYRRQ